jgi:HK97 family phage prohead protease
MGNEKRKPDFSGYVTKAGIVCTDGRVIEPGAFAHQNGTKVPFVWQHGHKDVENVLGHVLLEERDTSHPDGAGTYGYVYINGTPKGLHAKETVEHGDLDSMSIWANELKEKIVNGVKRVMHGGIKEVSLALSGANSGAKIDNVQVAHSDNPDDPEDPDQVETLQHDAFIVLGGNLQHFVEEDENEESVVSEEVEESVEDESAEIEHSEESNEDEGDTEEIEHATKQEIWDSLNEDQEALVREVIAVGLGLQGEDSLAQSEETHEGDLTHTQEGSQEMTRNVFEQAGFTRNPGQTVSLQHSGLELDKRWGPDEMQELLHAAMGDTRREGSGVSSLRAHLAQAASDHLGHAVTYGIENIDYLFPDARMVQDSPEFIKRRTEWVDGVLNGVRHSPFSRVKTMLADITADEARAKGYAKGNLKKDEWFTLSKRVTTPATIYKKQKLDRDDILDITEIDVVAWMKAEMRVMLDEEIARAILVGDGREVDDDDKIKEPPTAGDGAGIRPIAFDDDVYTHKVIAPANATVDDKVELILRARKYYKGSGNPTFYTTDDELANFLLEKDRMGRRLYPTENDVAVALRVKNIVTVEVMEGVQTDDGELLGIIVNLIDYTVGADKGAAIGLFDDFDIDYNQYKYLIETRISGALTKYKAALALLRANGTEVTPTVPTFVTSTGVLTVPTVTGVIYKNDETNATLAGGAQAAIAAGATIYVRAYPDTGYYFPHNFDATWSFTRDA